MTQEDINKRIQELEIELEQVLQNTPLINKTANGRINTHSIIRGQYKRRINNLKKFGAEHGKLNQSTIDKRLATMQEKYGAHTNIDKVKQTKLEKYGHMFGDKDQIRQTKIERYGNAMGDINKLIATKLQKYGHIY